MSERFTINTHDYDQLPVVVSAKALSAHISLSDLGIYVKVCQMLHMLQPDLDAVVKEMNFHGRYDEEEVRAGIQRLATAGLVWIEPTEDV
ncbi:hypothetical protein ACIQV3_36070 [Streptomyces sp. NPDC099050]|uniref:hypothetical protein n=1 Tax=Streptomyces sp. NPDC099050 TaxID=3366100 RepID=UPI00380353B0